MNKAVTIALIVALVASSLIMLETSYTQSIPKPSVPELAVKYVDYSTFVPPTYSTDQYTGKSVIAEEGYYQQNKSIVLTITNLPFTQAMQDQNLTLFYQVEYKGSYGDYWNNLNLSSSNSIYEVSVGHRSLIDPDASYTITALGFSSNNGSGRYGFSRFIDDVPDGGQIEFRIRAFVGYFTMVYEYDKYVGGMPVNDPTDPVPHYYAFTGEVSAWSPIQTFTMTENSPTPTPTVPELPALATLPLLLIIPLVAIVIIRKKKV